jgi:hypothetical protein
MGKGLSAHAMGNVSGQPACVNSKEPGEPSHLHREHLRPSAHPCHQTECDAILSAARSETYREMIDGWLIGEGKLSEICRVYGSENPPKTVR